MVGKVKIWTKAFETINQVVYLLVNDKIFQIRVMEEPVNANGFMNMVCNCKGNNYARSECPSSSKENSDSEKKDNVGVVYMVCNNEISEDLADKQVHSPFIEVDVGDDKGSNLNVVSFVGESTCPLKSGMKKDVEDVESNNLSLSVVGVDRNHNIEEVELSKESMHGIDASRVDDDHLSRIPEIEEESNVLISDDSSFNAGSYRFRY